ncbi:hypothetical protein ABBQ38_009559 [Trebouxia sp. C0009 RCD-2024]
MPELPEVEACRRLAERHCTGKRIQKAQIAEDDKVIEGIEPAKLQAALQGRTVKAAQRKGKHMWIDFDTGPSLMLHFGMTGTLVVKGVKSHQYRSFKVDNSDWPPKYWKVLLDLEGDVSIAFSDSRRFARVRLQEAPADHEPVSLLGFDPVLSMPSLPEFTELIKGQKRSLKALLLDQAFSAGVGNWVADEVLYQAQLYPELKAHSLTATQIQQLHEALQQVPEAAVAAEADSEKFPPGWLFHVRWDGKKQNPKIDGNAVEFLKVGGRTTAYVPAVQKAADGAAASQSKGRTKSKGKRKAESDAESGQEEDHSEEAEDKETQAGPSKGKKKKKEDSAAAGGGDTSAVKGKAKAGRAAVKQAEEDEQSAAGSEEDDDKEEEEAKPSRRRKGAAPAHQKKRKPGPEGQELKSELNTTIQGNKKQGAKVPKVAAPQHKRTQRKGKNAANEDAK